MAIGVGSGFGVVKGAITVYFTDIYGNAVKVSCATGDIPSGDAGYSVGCSLTDSTTGLHYYNAGSITSCTFTLVNNDSPGNIALTDGKIIVGNGSNIGAGVTPSGDATMTNTGVISVKKINGAILGLTTPTAGNILVGNSTSTGWVSVAMSSDAALASTGALTIASKAISGAKLATGKGYFIVSKVTNGTTPANVFGTTNGFDGTITGVWLISSDTSTANVGLATTAGTVCTIAKGATAGAVIGATAVANTTIASTGTCTVVSTASPGDATVIVSFTIA